MGDSTTKGRMLKVDISDSRKFAALSPHAAVLFCMIIPHLNSYGKLNGGPGYIKDAVCPRISYLPEKSLAKLLKEISDNTNMKWFEFEGRYWIHSVNFLTDHQTLRPERLGRDLLPNYSGVTPELVRPEVEVKEEVEVEDKVEGSDAPGKPSRPSRDMTDEEWVASLKVNPAYQGINIEVLKAKMEAWCDLKGKKPTRARLLNWLNREERPIQKGSTEVDPDNEFMRSLRGSYGS